MARLLDRSWIAAGWGVGVAIIGVLGGLARMSYWHRKGRWYPGMRWYGVSGRSTATLYGGMTVPI